jgi:TolB-like protein/class 3 adenylate cyclase/Flp pilus assembly protein TadD
MAEEGFKRKLTAILSADVEGYSRLMGEDEEATVRTLTSYREVLSTLIQQHNGKVLDSPGDNLLAEFVSVVDAVQCAVAVQKEIDARNTQLPENRRMFFRIGINLGDVIQEEERIYGDGVNIAARLESLANPGGICISKTAFDQIESKLPYGYEFLGDQTVKNIAKPVSAYRVLMEPRVTVSGKPVDEKPTGKRRMPILIGAIAVLVLAVAVGIWQYYMRRPSVEPASVENMAYPLPEKPSIAVLPFVNMSEDPKQEYFSDGLTEEIISALSKIPKLFVIARNSTFTYKGKPVMVQQVAEELGVRYVLEGSVRKAGDKVRITSQLIDAINGSHMWAERYDRELKDIFALQDEITIKIVMAMRIKLTAGEQARLKKEPHNLDAYLKYLEAWALMLKFKPENLTRARQLAEEAVAMDPNFSAAYTVLGYTHLMAVYYGLAKTPGKSIEQAFELAQKALSLDESFVDVHHLLGNIYNLQKQLDKAIAQMEQGLAFNPNSASLINNLAKFLMNADRPEQAIAYYKRAIRLNPYPSATYFYNFGCAYWMMKQYEKAIEICKIALKRDPHEMFTHMVLAASYSELDRKQEAHASAAEVLRINPKVSLGWLAKMLPWQNKDEVDRFIDALSEAGLK